MKLSLALRTLVVPMTLSGALSAEEPEPRSLCRGCRSKTRSGKNNAKTCTLPEIKSKKGKPFWYQAGQVMTQFDESMVPRKMFTEEAEIAHNDQYVVACGKKGYAPDQMCAYTCINGELDTSTYCLIKPEEVCVKARETAAHRQCPLDFHSDEPFYEGKSLKQWWAEVVEKFIIPRKEIFARTSDVPFYLGHGGSILEGIGLAAQHFIIPAAENNFDADAIDITWWIDEDYKYGPDNLEGSTTHPINAFVNTPETKDIVMGPFHLPEVTGPIPDFNPRFTGCSTLRDYDPCDDSKYLGFPPECFMYHPAGFHLGDGEMLNFRSPLSNGKIDLLGVCTSAETAPPLIVPALFANYDNVAEYIEAAGGLNGVHPATYTMHICVDDDPYDPYLCVVNPNMPEVDGDYVPVDVNPFLPMPTEMRKKLCAQRKAAGPDLCSADLHKDINYPFPWTQYL